MPPSSNQLTIEAKIERIRRLHYLMVYESETLKQAASKSNYPYVSAYALVTGNHSLKWLRNHPEIEDLVFSLRTLYQRGKLNVRKNAVTRLLGSPNQRTSTARLAKIADYVLNKRQGLVSVLRELDEPADAFYRALRDFERDLLKPTPKQRELIQGLLSYFDAVELTSDQRRFIEAVTSALSSKNLEQASLKFYNDRGFLGHVITGDQMKELIASHPLVYTSWTRLRAYRDENELSRIRVQTGLKHDLEQYYNALSDTITTGNISASAKANGLTEQALSGLIYGKWVHNALLHRYPEASDLIDLARQRHQEILASKASTVKSIIELLASGLTVSEISRRTAFAPGTIYSILKRSSYWDVIVSDAKTLYLFYFVVRRRERSSRKRTRTR